MKKIILIAKKEFLDMFRDKRTLIRMIMIPLLVFPLIIYLMTTIQESQMKSEAAKEIEIGYVLNGQSAAMVERMDTTKNITFIAYQDTTALSVDIENHSINMGIWFASDFDQKYAAGEQATYGIHYRSTHEEEYDRLENLLELQEEHLVQERLALNTLPADYVEPLNMIPYNFSSRREMIGKYAGGILPYIFMAFCFMGCMLPAIDLFAGEKERGTIETLLVTPVNRVYILVGKMIVVIAFGLLSATVALVGLIGSVYLMGDGGELTTEIANIVTPQLVITLYVLLIPIAIFFAGIMIPVSVYARSFKEAQSILTPMNMAVIIPAMLGFLPGLELNYTTAWIPIVNVVMSVKAVIAGNAEIGPLIITFASLILLSVIAVFISFKQFGKESNVLR
jgi:sodium transport system permease protein